MSNDCGTRFEDKHFHYAINLFIFTMYSIKMRFQFFILLSLFIGCAFGQNPVQGRLYQRMDLGVDLMEQGKYALAEGEFLYVMNNLETLPSEMAYYFGKNSYHLEKYKQSINWLNKYLQLKGTQGRFHAEASRYLQLAEEKYLEVVQRETQVLESSLSGGEYDCGGLDKMICPVCKGEGVVVKEGPFHPLYQTCPFSGPEPYLTCDDYNRFMRGELEPRF